MLDIVEYRCCSSRSSHSRRAVISSLQLSKRPDLFIANKPHGLVGILLNSLPSRILSLIVCVIGPSLDESTTGLRPCAVSSSEAVTSIHLYYFIILRSFLFTARLEISSTSSSPDQLDIISPGKVPRLIPFHPPSLSSSIFHAGPDFFFPFQPLSGSSPKLQPSTSNLYL